MKIAVAAESDAGEPQAAATPDTIRKMVALGADVAVEPGAGLGRIDAALRHGDGRRCQRREIVLQVLQYRSPPSRRA